MPPPDISAQRELVVRVAACQAVVDAHHNQPFVWGQRDCFRSILAPVLKALGHKAALAPFGRYANALGARRALKRNGFDSVEHYLDQRPFLRIAPAAALPADLLGLKGEEGDWLGIAVQLTNGRAFGFMAGADGEPRGHVIQPLEVVAAWRIPCLS